MDEYKQKITLENRKIDCERIMNKYPERIPVIVCKD